MSIAYSIAPWLTVRNGAGAVEFYKAAFGAVEVYRLEDPDGGVVSRLSVSGAEFWLSGDSPVKGKYADENADGGPSRMILTVPDPEAIYDWAVEAGATEVFPVEEGHGWRLGRICDPYGYHWEIGHMLA